MNPILAEVCRNGIVESAHRGSAIVVNTKGGTVFSVGDVERSIYPRSSLKFFQAIPLVESGAVDALSLPERYIALACASHNGEDLHVGTVIDWLARMGLDKDDLECGPSLPLYAKAAHQLIANHETVNRSHQNCSGKHTGMLALAKHLGVQTKGYSHYDHPVQQAWIAALSEVSELDVSRLRWEQDGCGMPAICMPMERLAFGFARFADPQGCAPGRARAMSRILAAVSEYPELIAGSERCCTDVITHTDGKVLVKTGAEAVYGGVVPGMGLGFALKIDDGATRGSEVALGGLLNAIGAISEAEALALKPHFRPDVVNTRQHRTGEVRAGAVWDELKVA